MTIIYTTETCPKCKMLIHWMEEHGINFQELQIDSMAITDFRINGIFGLEAPILRVGSYFYEPKELFKGMALDEHKLSKIFMVA